MQLRIKELRNERKWTVQHLADIVGMSKSYVSEIENGKKPANQLRIKKFADAFGVEVFELLDHDTLGQAERLILTAFVKGDENGKAALVSMAKNILK